MTDPRFEQYLRLLLKWNRVFNLTAITNLAQMRILHLADSLATSPYLHGDLIIDVGTGAGLPGIPLAIAHPEKKFTLLDSNSKKTRFLTQVVAELKLPNVEVIHARAEQYQPNHCFDSVISRAFSSLSQMLSLTEHLCCEQGRFLAMKGIVPTDEIKELNNRFIIDKIAELKIQGLDAKRSLIIIKKA